VPLIKAVALDVDKTITEAGTISPPVLKALRKLEKGGIAVILSSGNALPVLTGLKKYVGLSGAVIAENGGIVYYKGRIVKIGNREKALAAKRLVVEKLADYVEESWQNPYRYSDFAFKAKVDIETAARKVRELVCSRMKEMRVYSSGVAIHVGEKSVNKGVGLKKACGLMGLSFSEVVAVGDSEVDESMFKVAGASIAVANAVPRLKALADVVTSCREAEGFIEAANYILRRRYTHRL